MLKRFEVENFKGFPRRLCFDLSAEGYGFNQNLVENGIVKKAIIYGKNGVGKTSLGIALFDIISHLTDKERVPSAYQQNYISLEDIQRPALFKYTFMFDDDMVEYEYQKWDPDNLVSEKLTCNGRVLIDYEYFSDAKEHQYIDIGLKKSLNISLVDNKLSVKNTFTGTHQRIMNRLLRSLSSSVKTCYGIAGFRKEAIMQGL